MDKNIVLVNCGKSPISIFTPHAKPITILPGIGVRGDVDWLAKHIGVNDLTLIQQLPAGFNIRGIVDPMKEELVRDTRDPSHFRRPEARRPQPQAVTAPVRTKASEATEAGKSSQTGDLAKDADSSISDSPNMFRGRTADIWRHQIRTISDSTLSQQLKLIDLRELATLLDIDSADVLATKKDLITALRVKTGGRAR
jgi:hypothetical protein